LGAKNKGRFTGPFLIYMNTMVIMSLCRLLFCNLTVGVTCVWAGVDNAWEQKKLEARKMPENAAESHTSGARFVGQR
jgi:hypothetical protein